MDFICKEIKPYLSGTTNGKVPAERRTKPEGFCFQKDFAHCKWHEPQRQQMTYSRPPKLFSKQLRKTRLDSSFSGLHSLRSGRGEGQLKQLHGVYQND